MPEDSPVERHVLEAFLKGHAAPSPAEMDALARKLAQMLEVAHQAWPEVRLPPEQVAAWWGEHVDAAAGEALADALARAPVADLYIAHACGSGDRAALDAFEKRYFATLGAALARASLSSSDFRDVLQILREKLFVARPGRRPRIVEMVGRGDLDKLVTIAAIRTALNLQRSGKRLVPTGDDALIEALMPPSEATSGLGAQQHRGMLEQAFERAVADLDARDRNVLRMHLLHDSSIDEIGRHYGVHRATAARWLGHIRDHLRVGTIRALREDVGPSPRELDSILRMVDDRIAISFARLLASTANSTS